MASNRYDQRKNFEEAEANAIGTEMLRADLLPLAGRSITKRSHAPRGAIAGVAHPRNAPTSLVGQSRRIDRQPATSGLPLTTDIVRQIRLVPRSDISSVHLHGAFGDNRNFDAVSAFRRSFCFEVPQRTL